MGKPSSKRGDLIGQSLFQVMILGHIAILNLQDDETQVRMHFQNDNWYVTKIMSCLWTPNEVEDHQTRQVVNLFEFPEAILIQNKTKHALDGVNNWCHDSISFAFGWQTCWWSNHQFTFFLSVTEGNAVNSRACAHKMPAESQINFCKKLA